MLLRAIDQSTHAFLNGRILFIDAEDPGERFRPLFATIDLVVIAHVAHHVVSRRQIAATPAEGLAYLRVHRGMHTARDHVALDFIFVPGTVRAVLNDPACRVEVVHWHKNDLQTEPRVTWR